MLQFRPLEQVSLTGTLGLIDSLIRTGRIIKVPNQELKQTSNSILIITQQLNILLSCRQVVIGYDDILIQSFLYQLLKLLPCGDTLT